MHRKFYLENANMQRVNLQDLKNNALLVSPAGLGLAMQRSYLLSGDSAACVDETFPVRSFTGKLVFGSSNAYEGYRNLVNFIAGALSLKLIYVPRYERTPGEYMADVKVESLTKSEVSGGRMECDLAITLMSPWYKRDGYRIVAEKTQAELRYDRVYEYVYSDVSTDYIEVFNDGHFDAALSLEAEGELVNPRLALYVNNTLRSELVVNTVIEAGETLLYSSKDGGLMLKKRLADGSEQNLMGCVSVENDNFFKLPKGQSVLSLTADNEIASKIVVTVFMAYKAV
jgi:hypothetical protein